MNNLKSYTEYAVTTPTTDFVIGFDFNYGTDAVNVTVDGVPTAAAGYSVIYLNSTTMRLSPAVPSGVVRLQRETDIDVPDNQFTAGAKFIASNMDENFTQLRHAQQEVRDGFSKLSEDTYEIIDTLQVVGQAAQDAADAAEQAAQTANDAAAQVNDKVSYTDLNTAIAATPHNNLQDRDATDSHPASAISYGAINQEKYNNGLESIAAMLAIANPINGMRVYVKGYRKPTLLVEAIPFKGGGWFVYDQTKSSVNDTGMVINGWVRQLEVPPNPYHFGAYGDWNPTAQSGHDDSAPFQKCIDYILSNYTDYRSANSGRQLTLEIGSYLVGGLQFRGGGWSFRMVGQGMYTQLWHKKELGSHVVNLELTYFENIFFNGAAKPAAEPVDMVDYVFDFYLLHEALDIDTHFNNCGFMNYNTFARVDGRGFKTTNCTSGGGKGALLEIYCDPNATYSTSLPVHTVAASMRHYVIEGLRVDAGTGLIKVTGTGSQKDYINGITIRNSEIVGCHWLIDAPDATLVGLRIQNNFGIQCFPAWRGYGAVLCKGIVNAIDTDNNWNNYLDNTEEGSTDFRMAAMYRANTIDGLTISKLRAKDNVYSIVRFVNSGNNIKVLDSTFKNFSPESTDGRIIWNESNITANATNVLISGNTVDSKTTKGMWMNNVTGSYTFKAVNNIYPPGFDDQRVSFNPKLLVDGAESSSVTRQYNKSYYEIDGNYINCYIEMGVTTTLTSGVISLQLPVAAVAANIGYSSLYSGFGRVDVLGGFAPDIYTVRVHAATEQRALIQLNGTNVNLASKTGNTITTFCGFRYKFK